MSLRLRLLFRLVARTEGPVPPSPPPVGITWDSGVLWDSSTYWS